jgi:hypothetical protein
MNHSTQNISVTTITTDVKVLPAKYETGFKKVNSKSANIIPTEVRERKLV